MNRLKLMTLPFRGPGNYFCTKICGDFLCRLHRLGDYRGHISIAYRETRPGAVNTLGGGPWPFSAGRPAMAEPERGGMMGRPEPPADEQHQRQRQRAKQTRPPMRKAGSRPPAPPARQRPGTTSQRRQHQQSASQANAPAREDTNARDFSSPPLIAIRPLLYPPPAPAAGPPGADEDLCGFESAKID